MSTIDEAHCNAMEQAQLLETLCMEANGPCGVETIDGIADTSQAPDKNARVVSPLIARTASGAPRLVRDRAPAKPPAPGTWLARVTTAT